MDLGIICSITRHYLARGIGGYFAEQMNVFLKRGLLQELNKYSLSSPKGRSWGLFPIGKRASMSNILQSEGCTLSTHYNR